MSRYYIFLILITEYSILDYFSFSLYVFGRRGSPKNIDAATKNPISRIRTYPPGKILVSTAAIVQLRARTDIQISYT